MLGASIDVGESEQIELGESVKAPIWNDGGDDDDNDDDDDDKENDDENKKPADGAKKAPGAADGDAVEFKPPTAAQVRRRPRRLSLLVTRVRGAAEASDPRRRAQVDRDERLRRQFARPRRRAPQRCAAPRRLVRALTVAHARRPIARRDRAAADVAAGAQPPRRRCLLLIADGVAAQRPDGPYVVKAAPVDSSVRRRFGVSSCGMTRKQGDAELPVESKALVAASATSDAGSAAAAAAAARAAAEHGVYLFGQPGAQCPVSCNVRFVEIRPKMLSADEVSGGVRIAAVACADVPRHHRSQALRLHVLHGVWQCPADGVRNGPQVID